MFRAIRKSEYMLGLTYLGNLEMYAFGREREGQRGEGRERV